MHACDEFVEALRAVGLVTPDDLTRAIAAAGPGASSTALAQGLTRSGKLTSYQVEQVMTGRAGELILGNYEVVDRLGAGGMGTVFKARHRRMKRVVALKVLSRAIAQDPSFLQRFQREVETVARLSHPNVVMAFDADEAAAGPFLVMEFVNGRDLASRVQERGPLPLREAIDFTRQTAQGLGYAHAQGIIHRDIKPANLLCDEAGVVKVTDMGLARLSEAVAAAEARSGLTQAGGIVGTADYMPPEQAFDTQSVDHRSDIYSLGCTLWYLLTGAPPYQAPSIMAMLLRHREAAVPTLSAVRPDAPAALDAVLRKLLAKAPADRYQSMAEVVAALDAVPLPSEQGVPFVGDTAGGNSPSTQFQWPGQDAPSRTDQTVALAPLPGPAPQPPARIEPAVTAPSVLLVEPSRTQAAIIRQYLQALGITAQATVGSGADALAEVKRTRPDAVIAAMHLRDMTGAQLAGQVAALGAPAVGFVVISSEEERDAGTSSEMKAAVILPKPFDLDQLTRTLAAVTRRHLKAGGGLTDSKTLLPSAQGSGIRPPIVQSRDALEVLLVDDSAPARRHERTVLEGLGVTKVTEASDGAAAVSLLAGRRFDLIVTDYHMPHMDGRGLVGYLRVTPATARTPVILVTTEDDPASLQAIRDLGAVVVCDKTFAPARVEEALKRFFP